MNLGIMRSLLNPKSSNPNPKSYLIAMQQKKAIILLSGGLDSATAAAIAQNDGYELYALSFDYGQRHRFELAQAEKLAKKLQVIEYKIARIDLTIFGGSALTQAQIAVPKHNDYDELNNELSKNNIPITYVPARNTIFLSFAMAYAEVVNANAIYIGVNALDYSGYPDCRPEFISAFEDMANLATKNGVEGKKLQIITPLINMTKAEIIKTGIKLGVDYSLTSSCYDPGYNGKPCGKCDSCLLRAKGFEDAGIADPL